MLTAYAQVVTAGPSVWRATLMAPVPTARAPTIEAPRGMPQRSPRR